MIKVSMPKHKFPINRIENNVCIPKGAEQKLKIFHWKGGLTHTLAGNDRFGKLEINRPNIILPK